MNNNIKDIDLTSINNTLKEKGILSDDESVSLSKWCLSSEGYPTLENTPVAN